MSKNDLHKPIIKAADSEDYTYVVPNKPTTSRSTSSTNSAGKPTFTSPPPHLSTDAGSVTKENKKKTMFDPPYNYCFYPCLPIEIVCAPVMCLALFTGCAWGEDDIGIGCIGEMCYIRDWDRYDGTTTPCQRACACCIVLPLVHCCER